MSVFKCKMCGGALNIEDYQTTVKCEYCGTTQTLPKLDDERRANMYDRANHFRRNNDYDKAMSMYEQILAEDNTDSEAYWSIVLCRYGIEYVEDPATHKRLPTVNRAQYTSIFADEDYKAAIANADTLQKSIYEQEAKAIDEIQKGILEISNKEEPFDVFISFKETDANGRRTPDAVLANELYHGLTQEGFKVFYAPITLEDKLGTAYEPYIFAALNSAKVMVVLGTKPENFNAVWVKNEWSRFLALIKNGAKKILIPAYKDMDPYDLPDEFSHLMAQDMSKLGFMQDIIRGIRKIVNADAPKTTAREAVVVNPGNANTAPLLERAFMFLEDGDWQKADDFCEQILNKDPKNAQAYLVKLMAELRCSKKSELKGLCDSFSSSANYSKIMRFGSEDLKSEIKEYDELATENHNKIEAEKAACLKKLRVILGIEPDENSVQDFEKIKSLQDELIKYKKELDNTGLFAAKKRKELHQIIANNQAIISDLQLKHGFGRYLTYSYNENIGNIMLFEPIEWIVIDIDFTTKKALVISKYALDCQQYNLSKSDVTWETCSLRKWLNETFLNHAFSPEEQAMIVTTKVPAHENQEYSTDPGNATNDKVFLLSITEAEKYLSSDSKRLCAPTDYAKVQKAWPIEISNTNYFKGLTAEGKAACAWWLRSPGDSQERVAFVSFIGSISYGGTSVDYDRIAVRPALWIDLSK